MRVRPPQREDLDAVLALALARDIADLGAPDYTRADLESEWDAEWITLADDARIALRSDGTLGGYAILGRSEALVIVAPDAVGQGIGGTLLAWSEQRERELGRTRHRRYVAATDTRGQTLLREAGYVRVRSFWRMSRSLHAPVAPAPIPAGITLTALDPEHDGAVVHALDERSFAGSPDFSPPVSGWLSSGVASDNARALRLYERVGMAPRFQIDSFERDAR